MAQEIYLTKEGFKKLQKELNFLVNKKRQEVIDKLQRAKAYGDLAENSEYESAREEQAFVEGRIKEIEDILKKAKVIEKQSNDVVSVGSHVVLQVDGREEEYQIVGSNEANPSERKISYESPLGKSILNKRVGDEVVVEAPVGMISYKIKKIF